MSFGNAARTSENEHAPELTEQPIDDGGSVLDGPLPPEVTQADLTKYTEANLNGRLAHFTRERLFERNRALRDAYQIEIERTAIELNRRAMYARAEAERVFKL